MSLPEEMMAPEVADEIVALRTEHEELRRAGGYRDPQRRLLMGKLEGLILALEAQAQANHRVALVRERIRWSREILKPKTP
ncbi:hypothetical protein [Deinococcus humi]|uniref:Uncharacterized protein n=1 Tax=Deinococcus humi TaxID=662880 RepID=A0A7W8JSQ7_9DEIO|nr:hypothetical protein [Deinococcus humi]MBB5361308.1 hypothetical protein [Deinococcus humi]GGO19424.1 hypothetical protein GCM10008949_03740 [Deinococcus humi]